MPEQIDTTAPIATFTPGQQIATELMISVIRGIPNTAVAHAEFYKSTAETIDHEIAQVQSKIPRIIIRENPLRAVVSLNGKEMELSGMPLWETTLLQKFLKENSK